MISGSASGCTKQSPKTPSQLLQRLKSQYMTQEIILPPKMRLSQHAAHSWSYHPKLPPTAEQILQLVLAENLQTRQLEHLHNHSQVKRLPQIPFHLVQMSTHNYAKFQTQHINLHEFLSVGSPSIPLADYYMPSTATTATTTAHPCREQSHPPPQLPKIKTTPFQVMFSGIHS